jgi:hypothetical protein
MVKNNNLPSKKKLLESLNHLHDLEIDGQTLDRDIEQLENFGLEVAYNRKENGFHIVVEESNFPASHILPINVNEIAKGGGLLNCVSWNLSIQTRPMNILFSKQIE